MSPKEKVERKLAAIVFTDIADYTALSANDSTKASELLIIQRDTLKPIVEKHGGSWMKEIGDGLLLTFDSATNAVECSIAIQKTTQSIESLNLRIGIHQGEVIKQDDDVIGDDVNIASRIEPFSAIGGVAISDKIYRDISSNKDFETEYIGKPKLKGVSQEVKVYCLSSHGLPKTDISKVTAKLEKEKSKFNFFTLTGGVLTAIGILFWLYVTAFDVSYAEESDVPSVAILPFENKGAPQDEFYAYAISSDLITDITSAGLIRVASLADVEKLDYKKIGNSELAKKIFVRYVAKGTLWKMDTIFQLSMEIFDTQNLEVVYNNRWQTSWNNLTSIKDDLSENILNTLKVKVNHQQKVHMVSINPDAYELYLKAKHKFEKRETFTDTEVARGLLRKAIELDKNLLSAKILLGTTFESIGDYDKALEFYSKAFTQAQILNDKLTEGLCISKIGGLYNAKGDFAKALEYHSRALKIFKEFDAQSNIAESLFYIGWAHQYYTGIDEAMEYYLLSFEKYKKLNDKYKIARGLNSLGIVASNKSQYKKAIEYYQEAIPIIKEIGSKGFASTLLSNIGYEYTQLQNYELSIDYYSQALKIDEELGDKGSVGHIKSKIGNVYMFLGDYKNSLEFHQKSLSLKQELNDTLGFSFTFSNMGEICFRMGDYSDAENYYNDALNIRIKLGINSYIGYSYLKLGYMYCIREDYKQAIVNLEKYENIFRKEKGEDYERTLSFISYLYLSYKKLGRDYDESEIRSFLNESKDKELNPYLNYVLYQLLEERHFLEKAYNQFLEKTDWMNEKMKRQFFNYPFPTMILQEYNKLYS